MRSGTSITGAPETVGDGLPEEAERGDNGAAELLLTRLNEDEDEGTTVAGNLGPPEGLGNPASIGCSGAAASIMGLSIAHL